MKTFKEFMSERDTTADKIAAWIHRKMTGDKTTPLTKDEKIRARNQLRSLNRMLDSEKGIKEEKEFLIEMPVALATHIGTNVIAGKHSVEIATHVGKKLKVHKNNLSTQTLTVDHPTKDNQTLDIPYDKIQHIHK